MLPPLLCSRPYDAPPELIFRAFTEPAPLERWLCPSPEIAMRVDRREVRPGGVYRFIYHFPDSTAVPVTGTYQIVTPPRQLVFTWTWEPPDEHAGVPTLVTVDLDEQDGGTRVRVKHERFPAADVRVRHEARWAATLETLDHPLPHTAYRKGD